MKKILIILAVVLAVLGASIWFVMSRYGIIDPAEVVPGDAVAFITFPDLVQTGNRWKQTSLAKIGEEPSVADFLAKPLERFGHGGADEAKGILDRLKPGRIFLAVHQISPSGASVVAGFQYFGSRKDFDEAIGRLHREVEQLAPGAKRSEVDYEGDAIVQYTSGEQTLFTAAHGSWGFVSNDLAAVQSSLDRAAGRSSTPALAASDDFKTVRANLSKQPEMIWYVKTAPVLDVLLAIGSEQGGTINPAQLEQVKKVPALGGSLTFSGADQLERIYLIWKDAPKLGSIDRSGLAFSSPDNILFMESVQDWSSIASDEYVASLPPEIRTALEENQIDLKAVPAMFGADATFVANWPNGAMFPSALFSLGITDRGGVEGIVRRLIENYLPDTTVSSRAGATVFEFPKSGLSLIDPTVGISDKFLIGSLTSSGLDAALMRNPSQPTIEASPAFQNVSGEWKNDLQSFIFIDARTIFERVYNSLRPMVIFGAAMSPGISQTIDVEKLPETDVIAKHLGPIVMTQRVESNGVLIESRGPVTLYQSIILIGAGAGGAAAAQAFMQPR